MTELSGITVTPGSLPPQLRDSLATAVERIGAKMIDTVRIDTTHFVCIEGKGKEWERAVENNIPVVRPEWVEGCEREGRIVGVRGYYLNADPRLRQVGQSVPPKQQQSDSIASGKGEHPTSHSNESTPGHQRTTSEPPAPPEKDPGKEPAASRTTSSNSIPHIASPRPEGDSAPTPAVVDEKTDESDLGSRDGPELQLPDRSKESMEGKDADPGEGTFSEVQL